MMVLDKSDWDDLSNYRDYLEHYGVLGMKWGVRKDRKTGSSTSSTAKKTTTKKVSFRERRAQQRSAKAKEAEKKKQEKIAKAREEALKSPTKLYKNRNKYNYSQDEINSAIKRFEWEAKLSDLSSKELMAGKKYIDTVYGYANSAINIYNTAAKVVNSFNLSEKPWTYVEKAGEEKKDKKNK